MDELDRVEAGSVSGASKLPIYVILDDVRSMHNVGSVFRTCDAFAIKELFLCGYTPKPPHRDIHKTALGATETVAWQHFATTTDAIGYARTQGCSVWSVEQAHNSVLLPDIDRKQLLSATCTSIALVLGNEVTGVSDEALALSDGCIEIPQWGAKHSLNISVAAGVVTWQLVTLLKGLK